MMNTGYKKILYLICMILIVSTVNAYLIQNQFNDGTTAFNTTTNITKYIDLPTSAIILNASLSIGGFSVYNLTANTTETATLKSYSPTALRNEELFINNGDSTFITIPKPTYFNSANWSYRYGTTSSGLPVPSGLLFKFYCNTSTTEYQEFSSQSINTAGTTFYGTHTFYYGDDCFSKAGDTLQLKIERFSGNRDMYFYSSSTLTNFTVINVSNSLPNNLSILLFVNNTQVYNNTLVNGTYTNVSLNKSLIQNFVQTQGTVPITFNFSTFSGMLSVYDLLIEYQSILDLSIYDETTDKLITENSTVEIISDDLSFVMNRTTVNGKLNITSLPQNDYKIRYYSPSYRTRSYFVNIGVTAVSLDLFNINASTSNFITVQVTDERGQPVVNAIVKMYKSFINRGAIELPVQMEKTDFEGNAGFYVEPYITEYSFIVEDVDGIVIFTSASPTKITGEILYIAASRYPSSYTTISETLGVTSSILFNNNTQILQYTWNDPNNVLDEVCFNLTKTVNFVTTPLTYECSSSYSGLITLNLTGILQNNTRYSAVGVVNINNQFAFSNWEYFNSNRQKHLGKEGLFISWMIIVTLFLIGVGINYGVAIGYTLLGMVMLQVLEVSFFTNALISLIGIIGLIIAILNKQ